jgi:dihydrofolate synthase/folylpolyglutamate synthase
MSLDSLLSQLQDLEREQRFHRGEISSYTLDRMVALAAALGSPERRIPCVHVTGTNGKGSTCTYLAALARAHGLRDGLYTSPHLWHPCERIAIRGEPVSEALLERVLERVLAAAGPSPDQHPTYFEAMTLGAFVAFAEEPCDLAVYEVGLGGRLDATNVVQPLAAAITTIGLDHTAVLGPTKEAIAREKAGIFKPHTPAFTGALEPGPRAVVAEAASALGCPLTEVAPPRLLPDRGSAGGIRFALEVPVAVRGTYELRTPATYQAANAALALTLFAQVAPELGVTADPARCVAALASTSIPGRFTVVEGRPTIVMDGGHTEQAVAAAIAAFAAHFAGKRHCVLIGALADKDKAGLARALKQLAAPCVVTQPESPRAMSASELLDALRSEGLTASLEANPEHALERAREIAGDDGVVLVTGSFYLIAKLLGKLGRVRHSWR